MGYVIRRNKKISFCELHIQCRCINVVVQFYPWLKFYFPLCLGMVMYDNEFKTKEIKFEPRIKLNHNINTFIGFFKTSSFA